VLLERPPLEEIPFAAKDVKPQTASHNKWNLYFQDIESDDMPDLHRISRQDFFHPLGLGGVRQPVTEVIGFQSHAFHRHPGRLMSNPEQWNIKRLELVSLLKFEEPRVYQLDHLPRMDQLAQADVPTRLLTDFEVWALEQLWTEKDIVLDHTVLNHTVLNHTVLDAQSTSYQMLGSLRAGEQCLECHSVARGELLGAFSYELEWFGEVAELNGPAADVAETEE
jgi:hypothetical protein